MFDPFMSLSLPFSSTTTWMMTFTVSLSGSANSTPYTITVPKNGNFEEFIEALGMACSLDFDETLLVAEVSIFLPFELPTISLFFSLEFFLRKLTELCFKVKT